MVLGVITDGLGTTRHRFLREVTGVSKDNLHDLLTGTSSTEALKNALADSKFDGIKLGLLPPPLTQVPSTRDEEQRLTCLASTWQSEKETGSLPSVSL